MKLRPMVSTLFSTLVVRGAIVIDQPAPEYGRRERPAFSIRIDDGRPARATRITAREGPARRTAAAGRRWRWRVGEVTSGGVGTSSPRVRRPGRRASSFRLFGKECARTTHFSGKP